MTKLSIPHRILPAWAVVLGTLAIGGHLLAVVLGVLAVPSGPWPADGGSTFSTPPQFAYSLSEPLTSSYLHALGLQSHYHFNSNSPALPGASFEVRLKGESDELLATVVFPDRDCNFSVRHRQSLLAQGLANDSPIAPPQGEVIAAPNRELPSERIWELEAGGGLAIRTIPEHLIPRDRPVFGPSEQSLLLARSYARYLCRIHGAAKAEVIRHTQEPIPPAVMFISGPPPADASGKLVSNFGELTQ